MIYLKDNYQETRLIMDEIENNLDKIAFNNLFIGLMAAS
jgi:hypothetical protein